MGRGKSKQQCGRPKCSNWLLPPLLCRLSYMSLTDTQTHTHALNTTGWCWSWSGAPCFSPQSLSCGTPSTEHGCVLYSLQVEASKAQRWNYNTMNISYLFLLLNFRYLRRGVSTSSSPTALKVGSLAGLYLPKPTRVSSYACCKHSLNVYCLLCLQRSLTLSRATFCK